MIEELRSYWMYSPEFRDLPGHIQGKFAFPERPQRSIVVKTGSGTQTTLSADNFIGTVSSHIYLSKFLDSPGVSIEWVREDRAALAANNGCFPSPPGTYFIEVQKLEDGNFQFFVDPLLDVRGENVMMVSETEGQLQNTFFPGSLRLFEMPAAFLLQEGKNYTADPETGAITLADPVSGTRFIQADYKTAVDSTGPFPIVPNHANNYAIPGVVMAFGRRLTDGDKLAIVVRDVRCPSALEYGGRWDLQVEFEVTARDIEDQEHIADTSVTYLFGLARSRLATEGIEITEVSMGGESEEIYDTEGDLYYYTSNFSMTVQTDWFVWVPIIGFLRQAAPLTLEAARYIASLPTDQLAGLSGDIKMLAANGLVAKSDPFFRDRSDCFETIR